MKQKLFENIGGNTFKLITEGVDEINPKAKLVREGLKKVFGAGHKEISYQRLQGVGLGYIKSVEEAKKTAIQEARSLAKECGYMDDENTQKFVKEDETNMADPSEAKEVQIAKRIIEVARHMKPLTLEDNANTIEQLAMELIQMHGQQ